MITFRLNFHFPSVSIRPVLTVDVEWVFSSSHPSALAAVVTRLSRFALCLKHCSHLLMAADSVPGSQSDQNPVCVWGRGFLHSPTYMCSCKLPQFPSFSEKRKCHMCLSERASGRWVRTGKFLSILIREASCTEPPMIGGRGQLKEQLQKRETLRLFVV